MMYSEIEELVQQYTKWLRDKTALREIDQAGWVELTTPYLDRHNDYVQIYVKKKNGGFLLTDDGYTLEDLKQSGCSIESGKRQELLRVTLSGFGVHLEEDALTVNASRETFAVRKHNLVQAILAVNDLFYLAAPFAAGVFVEDVASWLDLHEIRFVPRVKFAGRSGFDHSFDFVIPPSKARPERILRAINRPTRDTVQTFMFAWHDTKEVRRPDAEAYALLNDAEQRVRADILDALQSYEIRPVLWSQREKIAETLAA